MKLQIFNNKEFGEIRTVQIDGEPWLVGKDVAEKLGYERPTKAIQDHVDKEDKDEVPIQDSIGRMQKTPVINESGLYSMVMSSKLPSARRFRKWVTKEVLPTIRKHGAYMTPQTIEKVLLNPDTIIQLATMLKEEQQARMMAEQVIVEQRPKVLFADAVSSSKSTVLVGELAKILKQNGVENMGQNRLFAWLRKNEFLIKRKGSDYNMPTQKSMELGLFEIKETSITHSDGHISVSKTPKVTGKGQIYFVNKFREKESA